MQGDLAAWGIAVEERYTQPETLEVWEEHWEAFELFAACATQWRIIVGMSGSFYQGLDYQALSAARAELELAPSRQRLEQVRCIEAGALDVINSK